MTATDTLDPRHLTSAVVDLLAALERSPGDCATRLILADALADAGYEGWEGMRWLAEKGRKPYWKARWKGWSVTTDTSSWCDSNACLEFPDAGWVPHEAGLPMSLMRAITSHVDFRTQPKYFNYGTWWWFADMTNFDLTVCAAFAAHPELHAEWWAWVPPGGKQ